MAFYPLAKRKRVALCWLCVCGMVNGCVTPWRDVTGAASWGWPAIRDEVDLEMKKAYVGHNENSVMFLKIKKHLVNLRLHCT